MPLNLPDKLPAIELLKEENIFANPLTASSSAVIKATGDNSAMVIATIVLSVVGVLGLAVRKESALAL